MADDMDFDDLYADAIGFAEDEPPVPPDEEDFIEADAYYAMEQETTNRNEEQTDEVIATETMDVDKNKDSVEDVIDTATSVRERYARKRPNSDDLYKFERYREKNDWRVSTISSPERNTMKATSWKSAKQTKSTDFDWDENGLSMGIKSMKTVAPSAPDAQLLVYLQKPKNNPLHCRMLRNPIHGKSCIPMTLADGSRVYIVRSEKQNQPSQIKSKSMSNCTLGVSMRVLMSRVENIQRKKEHSRNTIIKEKEVPSPTSVTAMNSNINKHQLWVDKHAPKTFAHLLSDERCNREVLRALRAWDPYVFGRDPPKRPEFQMKLQQQREKSSEIPEKTNPKDKRPDESSRVILLSGPPGVGKTTLAHVVAHHAGYRPIEVNGSDERSESALKDRVLRAMESSTINFGQENASKPNCLILDEIDGADAARSIQSLVSIIRAELPTNKTKSKAPPCLRRPIIFVCNNKFAPALKPLLPFARQFNVTPPSSSRLVARLRSVLSAENLSISGGNALLNELVTVTSGDIRSCLYTLQFASAQAKTQAAEKSVIDTVDGTGLADISLALKGALHGEGLKDERSDVATTITTIFRREKAKGLSKFSDNKQNIGKVFETTQSFGDISKVLDCLFLNVPRIPYIDPTFDRCAAAHELMSGADLYRSLKASGSDMFAFESMYVPVTTAAIHLLCRVEQRQELTLSVRELTDASYQREANMALVQKFSDGMSLKARGTRGSNNQSTEVIPFLLWVLSAGEGSNSLDRAATSIDLLGQGERVAFDRHASALQSLGLSYILEQDDETQNSLSPIMRLEPPIHQLVQYVELANNRKEVPIAMKEMLSRKATHDRLTDQTKRTALNDKLKDSGLSVEAKDKSATRENSLKITTGKNMAEKRPAQIIKEARAKKAKAQNFLLLGAKKAKAARSARNAARVGFQRNKNKVSHTGSQVPLSQVVRLKYVKGFTQAVRTPCRIDDLA